MKGTPPSSKVPYENSTIIIQPPYYPPVYYYPINSTYLSSYTLSHDAIPMKIRRIFFIQAKRHVCDIIDQVRTELNEVMDVSATLPEDLKGDTGQPLVQTTTMNIEYDPDTGKEKITNCDVTALCTCDKKVHIQNVINRKLQQAYDGHKINCNDVK
jgi:hypothetical protein